MEGKALLAFRTENGASVLYSDGYVMPISFRPEWKERRYIAAPFYSIGYLDKYSNRIGFDPRNGGEPVRHPRSTYTVRKHWEDCRTFCRLADKRDKPYTILEIQDIEPNKRHTWQD